jgi:hypothetical protein
VQFSTDLEKNISCIDLLNNKDSGIVISFCTANNIRLLIISCPTDLSTFNVEIISITSCSQTSISERTFKHLQSKSGQILCSSFKLDIEEKYLFKISAFFYGFV